MTVEFFLFKSIKTETPTVASSSTYFCILLTPKLNSLKVLSFLRMLSMDDLDAFAADIKDMSRGYKRAKAECGECDR